MDEIKKDIKRFKKENLRAAVTNVTNEDGSKQREYKDSNGQVQIDVVDKGGQDFMVVDTTPDREIAIVMPGLCIGKFCFINLQLITISFTAFITMTLF